jgi:hypothetical protein
VATSQHSLDAVLSHASIEILAYASHPRSCDDSWLETPCAGRRTLMIHPGPCQAAPRPGRVFLSVWIFRVPRWRLKSRKLPPERRTAFVLLGTGRDFLYAPGRLAFIARRCRRRFMGGFARVLSELWDTKYRAGDDLHKVWLQLERSRCPEIQGDDVDESAAANSTGRTAASGAFGASACTATTHANGWIRGSRFGGDGRRSASCRSWSHGGSRTSRGSSASTRLPAARWCTCAFRAQFGSREHGRF